MTIRVLLILLCALLAGCSFEMPAFDAGKLERHVFSDNRDRAVTSDLSPEQLSEITAWFAAHQTGWKKSYVDAAPVKIVYLSKAGAPVAYFNLSSGIVYAASYSRVLTSSEEQSLEAILNERKDNQSAEPTPTSGTSAAEQPLVPAAVVAHL